MNNIKGTLVVCAVLALATPVQALMTEAEAGRWLEIRKSTNHKMCAEVLEPPPNIGPPNYKLRLTPDGKRITLHAKRTHKLVVGILKQTMSLQEIMTVPENTLNALKDAYFNSLAGEHSYTPLKSKSWVCGIPSDEQVEISIKGEALLTLVIDEKSLDALKRRAWKQRRKMIRSGEMKDD